jgi:GNAT superfamily N-acetyltransferase
MAEYSRGSEDAVDLRAQKSPPGENSGALFPTRADNRLVASHLAMNTTQTKPHARETAITAIGDYSDQRTQAPVHPIPLPRVAQGQERSQEESASAHKTLPEGITIKKHEPQDELAPRVSHHPHPLFPTGQTLQLTAERQGEIWGKAEAHVVTTFTAGRDTVEPDTRAVLTDLEVDRDKRRQHIGTTLLHDMEEHSRASGATRIEGRIKENDPGYLHGPEFLAGQGYTVTQDESGFIFRKSLDNDIQPRGEIIDLRSLEQEPEPDEREVYLEQIIGRAKILSHDEYYRQVDMLDLPFADIGSTYYRSEKRISEGILINGDNLRYGWGDDFTHLTNVILEEKALEMWLTKDLSPDDHEGHAAAHSQAVGSAVEKAQTDGVLNDFLSLRGRQLHTFAEQGNPQALDELALYENAAEKIRERGRKFLETVSIGPNESSQRLLADKGWEQDEETHLERIIQLGAKKDGEEIGKLFAKLIIDKELQSGQLVETNRSIYLSSVRVQGPDDPVDEVIDLEEFMSSGKTQTANTPTDESTSMRRQGIGSTLLANLDLLAKEFGASRIVGTVIQEDIDRTPGLLEFYQKRGYQVTPFEDNKKKFRIVKSFQTE